MPQCSQQICWFSKPLQQPVSLCHWPEVRESRYVIFATVRQHLIRFHNIKLILKVNNFHVLVSWVEELRPPVLLELLATVCEDWSPRRQGQPQVSPGISKHQTNGWSYWLLVSVHRRHASQWHLPAMWWRPGPVAALRVTDDEASASTRPRHQVVPSSQLHLCRCRRGMCLLSED